MAKTWEIYKSNIDFEADLTILQGVNKISNVDKKKVYSYFLVRHPPHPYHVFGMLPVVSQLPYNVSRFFLVH